MKIRHFLILPLAVALIFFASCGDDTAPIVNPPDDPIEESPLTPPSGYMKAEPGIIGVDSKGNLTLDGYTDSNPVYIVYFKWGSLIAMKGEGFNDAWDNGITDIAWVPTEYILKLGNITDYASVPYAANGVFPADSPAEGLGDPCHFAKKDGVAGGYRMPTGDPYEQFTDGGWGWETSGGTFGQRGRKSTEGQFYPAAGHRGYDRGYLSGLETYGWYWSSSPSNSTSGYNLSFYISNAYPRNASDYASGVSIRCVPIVN